MDNSVHVDQLTLRRRFLVERTYTVEISAARFPYLSILPAAARAQSRLGGSCASHSMQLLALVMGPIEPPCERPSAVGLHLLDRANWFWLIVKPYRSCENRSELHQTTGEAKTAGVR